MVNWLRRAAGALGEQGIGAGLLLGDVVDVPGVAAAGELPSGTAQSPAVLLGVEVVSTGGDRPGQGRHRAPGQLGAGVDLWKQLRRHGVDHCDAAGLIGRQHGLGEPVEQFAGQPRVGRQRSAVGLPGRGHRRTPARV
ncbi:hypothetical protein [Micromonospora tarensis]|uniref:hypothetical protein n=1 Tax=Micromonospora tarensis TaxID=2806100 RepID=UPI001EE3BFB3|nr:hypothetical protein [Micromonospora tarensis]